MNTFTDYGYKINLLHTLVVAPFLLWIGYKLNSGKTLVYKEKVILMMLGVSVLLFHGYQTIQKQGETDILKDKFFQGNLVHLFFIGPVVAWSGYKLIKGKRVTDLEKTTLLLLGATALLYHGYNTITKTFTTHE